MDLIKFIKNEPHTLSEIRASIMEDRDKACDIIVLLQKHHDFIQESIKVLVNRDAKWSEKQFHLSRFLHVVSMHAHAEEETLYMALKQAESKNARLEGLAGQDEHDVAYRLADELKEMDFELAWSEDIDAKARVLAGLVFNHIKEEESVMFPIAKKQIENDELEVQGSEYLRRCNDYIDDEMMIPRGQGYKVEHNLNF